MNISNILCVCILLALATASPGVLKITTKPDVDNLKDKSGSILGGTRLRIQGKEFEDTEPKINNIISVGNKLCEIIEFYTNGEHIECLTPSPVETQTATTVPITIFVNGQDIPIDATAYPTFTYSWDKTPVVYHITPFQAPPGYPIGFYGKWLTDNQSYMYEFKVGPKRIALDDLNQYIEYTTTGLFNITGYLGDNTAGETTLTARIDGNAGLAHFRWTASSYDLDGTEYKFKTIPLVESLSANSGSPEGGHLLTITGAGFPLNTDSVSVKVADLDCKVKTVKYGEITCETIEKGLEPLAPFVGGAGLRRQVWSEQTSVIDQIEDLIGTTEKLSIDDVVPVPDIPLDSGINVRTRMWGYFKAPRSGDYTFYMSSDDSAKVFLSTDHTPANKVQILYLNGYVSYRNMFSRTDLKSDPMSLEKDVYYYIEIWHSQGAGTIHFNLGVEIPAENETPSLNPLPKIHKLTIGPTTTLVREKQVIKILAGKTGQLRVRYGDLFTDFIDGAMTTGLNPYYTWSCTSIYSKMQSASFPNIGCSFSKNTVTGESEYTFSFNYAWTDTRTELWIYIKPSSGTIETFKTVAGLKVSPTYGILGSFTLSINGIATSDLAIGANANSVKDAILAVEPNLREIIMVEGSSDGDGGTYTMMLPGAMTEGVPTITINPSKLTGGGLLQTDLPTTTINLDPSKAENQFYWVIPSEFLCTAEEIPQVVVTANNLRAMCSGDCSYAYLSGDSLPTITSFTDGETLTFQGTNLPTTDLTITVGHSECAIVSATITQITCTKPQAEAGNHTPIVKSSSIGILPYSSTPSPINYPLTITSASPNKGSLEGGLLLTITGTGFPPNMDTQLIFNVKIGEAVCEVIESSTTELKCITGIQNNGNVITIEVGNVSQTASSLYEYSVDATPIITACDPLEATTYSTTTITISGQGFLEDATKLKVTIGDEECLIVTASTTEISCKLLGGPKGSYYLKIYVEGKGIVVAREKFPLKFEITGVSPNIGSTLGDTLLEVTGSGFSTISSENLVLLGSQYASCFIETVIDSTTLTCRTPTMTDAKATGDTLYDVYMLGRISEESDHCDGCKFKYSATATPTVTSISPLRGIPGDTITISGSGFGSSQNGVKVKLGEECTITTIADSSIVVTLPSHSAGQVNLEIIIDSLGKADATDITFTYDISVESVTPTQGSQSGNLVIITGKGFNDQCTVKFGTVVCSILSVTSTNQINCIIGGYSTNETPQLLSIDCGAQSYDCADGSVCGIAFMFVLTPVITAVSYNSDNDSLTITGFGFIDNIDSTMNIVTIGEAPCIVTAATTTEIKCTPLGEPTAKAVNLYVKDKGYARHKESASGTFNQVIPLKIDTISSTTGSFAGGNILTITGKGLGPDTEITICGQTCPKLSSEYSSYSCEVPALPTIRSQTDYVIIPEDGMLMDITYISSALVSGFPISNTHDNDQDTYFKSTLAAGCYIGIDAGEGWNIQLYSFMIIPLISSAQKYKDLQGGKVQGSDDNTTWEDLYVIEGPFEGMNSWTVPQNKIEGDSYPILRYRYYRYLGSGNCYISELNFKGAKLFSSFYAMQVCEVKAKEGTVETVSRSSYTYSVNYTPKLTEISPKFESTAGGYTVNFIIKDVTLDQSKLTVKIDEVDCTAISVVNNQETMTSTLSCTAGKRTNYVSPSLIISQSDIGKVATQGLTFLYAERWSDHSTWGGTVPPRAGESVHVPTGQTLVIDQETPILNLIVVEGILMIEDKLYNGPALQAHYIMIKGGRFIVGTEEQPFQNNCEIIMHGRRDDTEIPIYGNKVIAVRNGILDLHGVERVPTWTMLENTASARDSTITVQDDIDWTIGDVIVIASTSFDHKEAEVRTIVSVSGKTITLDKPLIYKHYAATESYGDDTIDMRAEVGLLTRNIKIHGVEEHPEEEHGVHILIASPGDETSIGRIENIEVYNAGQAFSMGRYPIHFHMIGKVMKSYIRNNSIHHTHNRACTIHGVHYLRVINNVAYHNKGHAFFIEDGIETKNIIMHNLGISTLQSWSLLNTDQSPATFWITNIDNQFINNHAAGGDRYGFWFDPPDHPTGPSTTPLVCPKGVKLGQFEGNSAHSYVKYGLRLFHGHIPRERPCDNVKDDSLDDPWSFNPTIQAVYKDFTGWKNKRNGAIGEELGDVIFEDFKVADNKLAGIEVSYVGVSKPFITTKISNSIIIGKSGNTDNNVDGFIGLITSQKDGLFIEDVRFYNINSGMFALGDESHSSHAAVRDFGARHHKFSKLKFTDSNKLIHWEIPTRGIFEFLDDSMTGTAGAFIAAYWPHLITPECEYQESDYNSIVCDGTVKIRRVNIYNNNPFVRFNFKNIGIHRMTGLEIPTETVQDDKGNEVIQPITSALSMQKTGKNISPAKSWAVPFVTGYKYKAFWGESPLDWEGFTAEFNQFGTGDFVGLHFNHTDVREFYDVNRGSIPSGTDTKAENYVNPTALVRIKDRELNANDPAGSFKWENVTDRYFEIAFTGSPANNIQSGDIKVTAYRCYGTHCSNQEVIEDEDPVVTTVKRWSNPDSWTTKTLPIAGQSIVIEADTEMILDIETPILNVLEIQGKIVFDPEKSAVLNAKIVFNRKGKISSGSKTSPTNPAVIHEIVLHGEPTDQSYAFDPSIEAGNKVLINTGEISFYGAPKKPWVKLVMNAYPKEEWIFVEEVDWSVGDEIVIGSSNFYASETETFIVSEVVAGITPYEYVAPSKTRRLDSEHSTYDFTNDSLWSSKNLKKDIGKVDNETYKTDYVNPPAINITKLKLSSPLKYYHIGIKNKVGYHIVDMRAEVGVLNRNIKIRGNGNGWKCNIVVANYQDFATVSGNPITRTGFVDFNNIEIKDCGQNDVDRTGLRFEKSGTVPSKVLNSVIRNSDTYGLIVKSAKNIEFTNNVIHYIKRIGVAVMSADYLVLSNNLVLEVQAREIEFEFDFPTAYWLCEETCTNISVVSNVASGYALFGFFLPGVGCTDDKNVILNNVAHSGEIGFVFRDSGLSCMKSDSLTAFLNRDMGVANKAGFETFTINNAVLAENKVGISIVSGAISEVNTFKLQSSVVIGQTVHTACENLSQCGLSDAPVECKSRHGIVGNAVITSGGKLTLTSKIKLPLMNLMASAENKGSQIYSDITLSNFIAADYCNVRHPALSLSDKSPDYTVPQFISKLSLYNIDPNSEAYMPNANKAWANDEDCGDWPCTGPYNSFFKDSDGTYFGNSVGGYILPNNSGVARKGYCSFSAIQNAYICPKSSTHKSDYAILLFESLDADNQDRMLSPVYIRSYDGILQANDEQYYNKLNTFMDHVWDGFYTGQKRLSRFPSLIELGRFYNITYTSTVADHMKYQLEGTDNNEDAIVVTIDYVRSNSVQVFLNGTYTQPLKYVEGDVNHCTLDHPSGTNKWFYDLQRMQFVIRKYDIVELKVFNSVQITAKFDMTIKEFFADNGVTNFIDRLAAALGIPSYRIRVVDVKQGSVIVITEIISDIDLVDQPGKEKGKTADLEELESVLASLIEKGQSGSLDLGYPLLVLETILVPTTPDEDTDGTDEPTVIDFPVDDQDSDSDGDSEQDLDHDRRERSNLKISKWYFLLLIALGGVLFFVVPLIIYLYMKRRSKKIEEIAPVPFANNTLNDDDSYRVEYINTQGNIETSARPLDQTGQFISTNKFLLQDSVNRDRVKKGRTITVTADL